MRRTAQLSRLYPHLKVHDIRGNLNTRLAKLDADDSKYAGIVLAQAGLERLGWQHRVNHTIDPEEMLYAIGQGALAVECRSNDPKILSMLRKLVCHQTQCRILAERSFLKTLGGGCSAPVAVNSLLGKRKDIDDQDECSKGDYELRMIGSVWSLDGQTEIQAENACYLNVKALSDLDADEVPSKRAKLSIDVENDNELRSENPSPPHVIDHSQINRNTANMSDSNQNLDIAGLLNAHSDAFKKCPYSSYVQSKKPIVAADAQVQNATNPSDKQSPKCPLNFAVGKDVMSQCPLNFAVGQDVMGQCPYFDESNSIENASKVASSCGNCPFRNGCATNNSESNRTIENRTKPALDITKCPFLASRASTSKDSNTSTADDLSSEKATEPLFCGIYPHSCWPLDVFEKCEQLGKNLAQQLIEKGALSVMECAQSEIRSKV